MIQISKIKVGKSEKVGEYGNISSKDRMLSSQYSKSSSQYSKLYSQYSKLSCQYSKLYSQYSKSYSQYSRLSFEESMFYLFSFTHIFELIELNVKNLNSINLN